MSDTWYKLVSQSPTFMPTEDQKTLAHERFVELAPAADEIEVIVYDKIQLFDCGGNLETISCPNCGAEIDGAW